MYFSQLLVMEEREKRGRGDVKCNAGGVEALGACLCHSFYLP